VQQAACSGQAPQRFNALVHIDAGAHWLFQMNSLLCGGITGASVASRAPLQQEACSDAPQQLFQFQRDALYGAFRIRPSHSNQCLEVPGGSLASGTILLQGACNADPGQRFRLEFRPEGLSFRVVSALSARCLDIPNGSFSSGDEGAAVGLPRGLQPALAHRAVTRRFRRVEVCLTIPLNASPYPKLAAVPSVY